MCVVERIICLQINPLGKLLLDFLENLLVVVSKITENVISSHSLDSESSLFPFRMMISLILNGDLTVYSFSQLCR